MIKSHKIIVLIYIIVIIYALINTAPVFMIVLPIMIFVTSFFNLQLGMILWAITMPVTRLIEGTSTVPFLFSPAFAMGGLLSIFQKRRLATSDFKGYIKYFLVILTPILFSSFYYEYYQSINALIIFPIILVIALLIASVIKNYESGLDSIVFAITVSAIIILFYIVNTGDTYTRLNLLDGEVRILANPFSLSILLLFMYIFKTKKQNIGIRKVNILILYFIVSVLGVSLIATISRATILSTAVSILLLMYFYSKELSNKHILRKNFRFYFLLIVLFLLSYLFYQSFGKSFFMGEDIISKRFSSSHMDAGVDARFGFWRKVFSNLTFNRVIFGNGVQSFSEIGKTYGVNTYAHSVFIDMLICGGLISFTAFISLIYSILRKAVKLKLHYIIPIVVYAILSYLSDGTINETLFWVPIGISIGLLHRASK